MKGGPPGLSGGAEVPAGVFTERLERTPFPTPHRANQPAGAPAGEGAAVPTELRRVGLWTILSADTLGKRLLAQCVCGQVREVNAAALEAGAVRSCGCRRATSAPDRRAETFASPRPLWRSRP